MPALRDVFHSIPQQTGKKFKYVNISPDNKTYLYKTALGLLIRAGLVNKGDLAELHVGLELIASLSAYIRPELHYWHREARASNAEVDYVIQKETRIIPVEVKAGTRGQMQSMKLFQSERGLKQGVCLGAGNFGYHQGVHFVPIYAAGCLRDLL